MHTPPGQTSASPAALTLSAHPRPLTLIAIAATTILAGAFLGATTNAINGAVSPTYFVNIMGWQHIDGIWRAAIAEGTLEGLVLGVLFALVFTATLGIITKAACPYTTALRYLLTILAAAYACWAAGGLIALALATFSPEFYRRTFIGVPAEPAAMLRYAWVGGSIWGEELGALLAVVIALVAFRARWRQHTDRPTQVE